MILCFGCSYTEHRKTSYLDRTIKTNFDRWPKILGKLLNKRVLNLGVGGASNDLISSIVREEVLKKHKKIDCIFILWSEWFRLSIIHDKIYSFSLASTVVDEARIVNKSSYKNIISEEKDVINKLIEIINYRHNLSKKNYGFGFPSNAQAQALFKHHILGNFLSTKTFCNYYNIPIIMMQGLNPSPFDTYHDHLHIGATYKQLEKIMTDYADLFLEDFIGWPIFKPLGGYTLMDKIEGDDPSDQEMVKKYFISDEDRHPNENGHNFIAKEFATRYKMLYV